MFFLYVELWINANISVNDWESVSQPSFQDLEFIQNISWKRPTLWPTDDVFYYEI